MHNITLLHNLGFIFGAISFLCLILVIALLFPPDKDTPSDHIFVKHRDNIILLSMGCIILFFCGSINFLSNVKC